MMANQACEKRGPEKSRMKCLYSNRPMVIIIVVVCDKPLSYPILETLGLARPKPIAPYRCPATGAGGA